MHMISFLYFLATLIVIVFVITRLVFPQLDSSFKTEKNSKLDKKPFNIGVLLLGAGPILAGIGMFGLMIRYWTDISNVGRLGIVLILLVVFFTSGIYLNFYKKNLVNETLSEALLILTSFSWGTVVFLFATVLSDNLGYPALGLSEILGIWALGIIPLVYITRSIWIIAIQTLIHLLWLFTYLGENVNASHLITLSQNADTFLIQNRLVYFILLLVQSAMFVCFYRWHEIEDKTLKNNRILKYSTGMLAFLSVGVSIWRGVVENWAVFSNQDNAWIIAIITAAVTLIIFGIDQIGKHYPTKYNLHWLVAIVYIIAGIVGLFPFSLSYFTGMYFLQTAFSLWLLVDFIRERSKVAETMFYVFNAAQIIALTISRDNFSLFQLIVLLAILIYAMLIHQNMKAFVYYVWVCVILSFLVKILILQLDFFWISLIIGLFSIVLGWLYTTGKIKIGSGNTLNK